MAAVGVHVELTVRFWTDGTAMKHTKDEDYFACLTLMPEIKSLGQASRLPVCWLEESLRGGALTQSFFFSGSLR